MKRRILSMLCVLTLLLALSDVNVRASEELAMIDGSYLTHEEESTGYAVPVTRGENLLTGYSKSVRLGAGLLYAGGTTVAAHTVDEVGVVVMVERAQDGDTSWAYYDGWTKVNENNDRAAENRQLAVEGGYYYRVRCTHWADGDVSSSFTNGVFIESP